MTNDSTAEQPKCKAKLHRGGICGNNCWKLQVGQGTNAETVGCSDRYCLRHDEGAYIKALQSLCTSQGTHLRFKADFERWLALRSTKPKNTPTSP